MELSDESLLLDFRNPQRRQIAFKLIIQKYQKPLYWHIRKMLINHEDTDDVLQNTLIKIWNALDNFREESKLYTWLYRIATNETFTFLAQRRKQTMVSITTVEKQLARSLESDVFFNGDEAQLKLQKAILTLPEKQRIVFNMKYYDEIKYEDMAVILETSVGALKASYHIASKKIEKYLEDN